MNVQQIVSEHDYRTIHTGVNPAGDAGDTSPNILIGERQREYSPNIIMYFRI